MPVTLEEYAIRVKSTQKYLPRPQRRDGRGGSHLEPVDFTDKSSWPKDYDQYMQIRSYAQLKAARNMLTSWLKGGVGCQETPPTCRRHGDRSDLHHSARLD
jgi:hypothetical protein